MDDALERLREVRSPSELARLGATVRTHAAMLDEESLTSPHVDYRLAQRVSEVLGELVAASASFDNEQRSWLAAAARYFILTEDEASDLGLDGLRDDEQAVRMVCEMVGRADLAARLGRDAQ